MYLSSRLSFDFGFDIRETTKVRLGLTMGSPKCLRSHCELFLSDSIEASPCNGQRGEMSPWSSGGCADLYPRTVTALLPNQSCNEVFMKEPSGSRCLQQHFGATIPRIWRRSYMSTA